MKKISGTRADNERLRNSLRGLIDAVNNQWPAKSDSVRKEIAYAEVVLKETVDA
jgi:hypothetical protein